MGKYLPDMSVDYTGGSPDDIDNAIDDMKASGSNEIDDEAVIS